MLVKETKEESEIRRREEMDRVAVKFRENQEERKLRLEIAKIESSVPIRWRAISEALNTLIMLPAYLLWLIVVFILELFKREVPDYLKEIW